jgi:microcystin-dependent protein
MSCTNCFNGCAETISDQCVKYTGIDVPALGISTGDSLLSVENAITNFLVPAINGTGIKPIIDANIICDIVKSYLPPCTTCVGFTLNEVLTAIIKTVCDLQVQITTNTNAIATLNADYTIGCLSGVSASSDTHDIVQATINNLCSLNTAFSTLVAQLNLINVTSLNIDTYIANYLASQPSSNSASAKMIPFCPIPYYGVLSGYPTAADSLSLTGSGTGYWNRIFLCNGLNNTPDLRGRVIVGTTTMGNNAFPPQTDPCGSCTDCSNPTYDVGTVAGANCVTLFINEIPSHTHLNTLETIVTVVDPEHSHTTAFGSPSDANNSGSSNTWVQTGTGNIYPTTSNPTGITVDVVTNITNAAIGGGDAHPNIQPVIALHYIMYIP